MELNTNWNKIIEGRWNSFEFTKITKEDYEDVFNFIKSDFLRDEATSKFLGYTDDYGEDFCYLMTKVLDHNISFMAKEKRSGEIAALRINWIHTKGSTTLNDPKIGISRQLSIMMKMLVQLEAKAGNIFDKFGVEMFIDFFVASVAKKYRKLGLAKEMYRRTLQFLKAENFNIIICRFSSVYSRAAARRWGFKELARWDYSEYSDEEENNVFDLNKLTKDNFLTIEYKIVSENEIF